MRKSEIYISTLLAAAIPLVVSCGLGPTNQSDSNRSNLGNQATSISGSRTNNSSVRNESASNLAANDVSTNETSTKDGIDEQALKNQLIGQYENAIPHQWGENTTGVLTHLATTDKVIALTFDACGGKGGSGYDAKLINYLMNQHIPATLFINSRWIDENDATFMALAKNPLFEIENHGYLHRPLSINGKSAWGIPGTQNVSQVIDEVALNEDKIGRLTGRRPLYFRAGTAYYDEDAVQIAGRLGVKCVNFSILGDAGATFNTEQIVHACLAAKPGSIIICHMNHPEKDTAEGIMAVVPLLEQKGFHFVKLDAYPLA